MTRIGVISDSHNMPEDWQQRTADLLMMRGVQRLVFLGDGAADAEALARRTGLSLTAVAGNCDDRPNWALEAVLKVEGAKILVCHGHILSVKSALIRLRLRAEELGCSVALYGHTHVQAVDYDGAVLMLNPGALRDGRYAVLEVNDGRAQYRLY